MIQKISLFTAALLLSLYALFAGSAPSQNGPAAKPQVQCPPCKFGYLSSGPPLCRCTKLPL
jgi:hypothetical protein